MCTRCIRFMDEVANDPVLEMRERGNLNEITVAPGRTLSGNYTFMTEHVCPVGALTTKDFRFKARVWFLKTAKSVCQHCATGCNAYLDYDPRNNTAYRHRPRENQQVNKYWMCDPGMLSYKRAHEHRVVEARVKGRQVTLAQALESAKGLLASTLASTSEVKPTLAVVLSAEHSLEDNYALQSLGKALGAGTFLWIRRAAGEGDDILRDTDKNSNSNGVLELFAKAGESTPLNIAAADAHSQPWVAQIESGALTHVVTLGSTATLDAGALLGRATTITLAAHEGQVVEHATVVLPATSWAEHAGVYVNKNGLHQRSERALSPQGSSKPAWQLVLDVAKALGVSLSFSTLTELRRELGEEPGKPATAPTVDAAHSAALG